MKVKEITIHSFMIAGLLFLSTVNIIAQTAGKDDRRINTLTIIVSGLKNNNGSIIIKLFNSRESYYNKGSDAYIKKSIIIKNHTTKTKFSGLISGEYAIKLFHDENGNGKHDKNFLGIPKEEYAFSNNAAGSFGPPDYEKAKFEINGDLSITIDISKKEK